MRKLLLIFLTLSFSATFLLGCAKEDEAQTANPASKYCEDQGHTLVIIKDLGGNEYGICKFADGTECEEWDYFRDRCKPGGTKIAVPVNEDQCKSLGGDWGRFGNAPLSQCNLPTKDSGKACTDGAQCDASLCIAEPESQSSGKCPVWRLNYGCMNILEGGKAISLCID